MQVVPGIDILDGKCVSPVHRSYGLDSAHSEDPAEVASLWASEGAERLWIADIDGARSGELRNMDVLRSIIDAVDIPIDFGGGIRSLDTAEKMFDMGVDRVVIGTVAALDIDTTKDIFESIGDKTVLATGSMGGYVALHDWQARTDEKIGDFIKRMADMGAKHIAYADVARKGMHGGLNIYGIKRLASSVDVPIIVSGGVNSLDCLRDLKEIEDTGIEGVVTVTALYSGAIDLSEAIKICK